MLLLMTAVACDILQYAIISQQSADSVLAAAVGRDWKGKGSVLAYLAAVPHRALKATT